MPSQPTNHPVWFLGPMPFQRMPILSLDFIQAVSRAELEIDLSALPPLISGGDRKARAKAIAEQKSSRHVSRRLDRRYRLEPDPAYGCIGVWCCHCTHHMLLEELDAEPEEITCDRCHRPVA